MSLSVEDDTGHDLAERLRGDEPAVEANLLAAEANRTLQAALDKLDETTKQMILLRHMGQMSFKDLAELFDCPLGTVLARVHRGLRTLRRRMRVEDEAE